MRRRADYPDESVRKMRGHEFRLIRATRMGRVRCEAPGPVVRVRGAQFFSCESPQPTAERQINPVHFDKGTKGKGLAPRERTPGSHPMALELPKLRRRGGD